MVFYLSITFFALFFVSYFYLVFSKKNSEIIRWSLLISALIMGFFPLLMMFGYLSFLGDYLKYVIIALNFILVGGVILFCLTFIVKIIMLNKPIKTNMALILLGLSFALTFHSLYEGLKVPPIKNIEVKTDKVNKDYKIVFLSDIHLTKNISANKIKKIVKKVNQENADAIILGGDIIDDLPQNIEPLVKELSLLKSKEGVFFVAGNHEVYKGILPSIFALQGAGFKYLFNSGTSLGDVYIAGIGDVRTQRNGIYLKGAIENAKETDYIVLASHSPYNFEEYNNFDLMLSGHTHGGQIFPFHILTKLYNKYLAGFYDMDNGAKIYVSRGAGQWGPQMRFLAPSEITVLNIKPD